MQNELKRSPHVRSGSDGAMYDRFSVRASGDRRLALAFLYCGTRWSIPSLSLLVIFFLPPHLPPGSLSCLPSRQFPSLIPAAKGHLCRSRSSEEPHRPPLAYIPTGVTPFPPHVAAPGLGVVTTEAAWSPRRAARARILSSSPDAAPR
jgi:hypothetical protein